MAIPCALDACDRSAPAPAPAPTPAPTVSAAAVEPTSTSTAEPPSAHPERGAAAGDAESKEIPAPPSSTLLRSAFAVAASSRIPLAPGAEAMVDPRATFELELSVRTSDARLVLVDAHDDFVAASSSREVGASTRLTLAPAAPLVPGSRYALRLDGVSARALHDEAGRGYEPLTLPLLAAGTPPPPEPKKPARKKRHR
jgi:hypothetical protein